MTTPARPIARRTARGATWRPAFIRSLPLRLSVLAICFLSTLPTLGLLVTSVRDPQVRVVWLVDGTSPPVRSRPVDAGQLPPRSCQRRHGQRLSQQHGGDGSFRGHPDHDRGVRGLRLFVDGLSGARLLFAIVIGLMVVPLQVALLPLLRLYTRIDLNGTFLGIWLAHAGFGLPLAIYLLYGHISSVPREIVESAYVDGATPMLTFTRLVLPLSVAVIASFAIFQFLWVWNDLLVALVFLGPVAEVRVLPAALYQLIGSRGGMACLTAGAFVTIVVPLLVFLLLQRAFVGGSSLAR